MWKLSNFTFLKTGNDEKPLLPGSARGGKKSHLYLKVDDFSLLRASHLQSTPFPLRCCSEKECRNLCYLTNSTSGVSLLQYQSMQKRCISPSRAHLSILLFKSLRQQIQQKLSFIVFWCSLPVISSFLQNKKKLLQLFKALLLLFFFFFSLSINWGHQFQASHWVSEWKD